MVNPAFAFVGTQIIPPTISGIADCFRAIQEEETKQQAIIANRDILIARLTAEKEAILAYFSHRFAERRAALDEFFELLRHDVDSDDNHQLNVALAGILGIIQDNPLADLEPLTKRCQASEADD